MQPDNGKFYGFDHLRYYCSNAFQAAQHFTSRFGFEFEAYSGLETGARHVSSHVVNRDGIRLVFQSALEPHNKEFTEYLSRHGDNIRDIAFNVEDVERIYKNAVARGAKGVIEPHTIKDEHGEVKMATLVGFDDTLHTLVERVDFKNKPRLILMEPFSQTIESTIKQRK